MSRQCQARGRAEVAVVEEAAQVAILAVVKVTVVAETLAHMSIGGLGMSEVGKSLLSSFKCIRLDDSEEGILCLRLSAYECDFTMCVFVSCIYHQEAPPIM